MLMRHFGPTLADSREDKVLPAFDLLAHPERIQPAYGFYAVSWAAGAVISLLALASVRRRWKRF